MRYCYQIINDKGLLQAECLWKSHHECLLCCTNYNFTGIVTFLDNVICWVKKNCASQHVVNLPSNLMFCAFIQYHRSSRYIRSPHRHPKKEDINFASSHVAVHVNGAFAKGLRPSLTIRGVQTSLRMNNLDQRFCMALNLAERQLRSY